MYNITAGTLKNSKNTLGIFEFGDIYAQGDLDSFYKTYASYIVTLKPTFYATANTVFPGTFRPERSPNQGLSMVLQHQQRSPMQAANQT
jgi:hypothetical protein